MFQGCKIKVGTLTIRNYTYMYKYTNSLHCMPPFFKPAYHRLAKRPRIAWWLRHGSQHPYFLDIHAWICWCYRHYRLPFKSNDQL